MFEVPPGGEIFRSCSVVMSDCPRLTLSIVKTTISIGISSNGAASSLLGGTKPFMTLYVLTCTFCCSVENRADASTAKTRSTV